MLSKKTGDKLIKCFNQIIKKKLSPWASRSDCQSDLKMLSNGGWFLMTADDGNPIKSFSITRVNIPSVIVRSAI